MKKPILLLSTAVVTLFLLFINSARPARAVGANLFWQPDTLKVPPNQNFELAVKLNTQQEVVNTAVIDIVFPVQTLRLEKVEKNLELTKLWFDEAEISSTIARANEEGRLTLIPGSADPGLSGTDLRVATLTFRLLQAELVQIAFGDSSAVYRSSNNTDFLAETLTAAIQPASGVGGDASSEPTPTQLSPTPTRIQTPAQVLPSAGITAPGLILVLISLLLIISGAWLVL